MSQSALLNASEASARAAAVQLVLLASTLADPSLRLRKALSETQNPKRFVERSETSACAAVMRLIRVTFALADPSQWLRKAHSQNETSARAVGFSI